MKFLFRFVWIIPLCLLCGCSYNSGRLAPVESVYDAQNINSGYYQVRSGDSLYSISWAYGLDFRDLARWNGLKSPYRLYVGQRLKLTSSNGSKVNKPSTRHTKKSSRKTKSHLSSKIKRAVRFKGPWYWPVKGKVVRSFQSRFGGNHGIDIKGEYNARVRASAAGKVVYSGAGVRGYGNLIIIEHSPSVLSAYAYNRVTLVKVGQQVKAGSSIARMGRNLDGSPMLHFEIRVNGKPVNPRSYLKG